MANAITAISTSISAESLWGQVNTAVPFIAGLVLFVFGYTVFRRVTKGAAKGKIRP